MQSLPIQPVSIKPFSSGTPLQANAPVEIPPSEPAPPATNQVVGPPAPQPSFANPSAATDADVVSDLLHSISPNTIVPKTNTDRTALNDVIDATEKDLKEKEEQVKDTETIDPQVNPENPLVTAMKKTSGPQESIKSLRQKVNESKLQLEEKERILTELNQKLAKFETGEEIPESVLKRLNKVEEVEHLESLVALETSPKFYRKYVEPLNELKQKAVELAKAYGVNPVVLNQASMFKNRRDQNNFLKQHFDEIGVIEIRELIEEATELNAEMQQAKTEPQKQLERLRNEAVQREQEETNARINSMQPVANSGWIEGLTEIQNSGDYPELTPSDDIEHTKTVVDPLVTQAAQEYAKFIKVLAALGTKELPKEVALVLAKRFLWSQASPVMAKSRAHHYQRAQDVIKESRDSASLFRPSVGVGTITSAPSNGNGTVPGRGLGAEKAADILMNKVLQSGRK